MEGKMKLKIDGEESKGQRYDKGRKSREVERARKTLEKVDERTERHTRQSAKVKRLRN